MNSDVQTILCGAACLPGVGIAGWYLASGIRRLTDRKAPGVGAARPAVPPRPWRALGAAICGLVGLMSFAGVMLLDWRWAPRAFIGFWAVILVLLLWLCCLALFDLARTRQQLRDFRAAQRRKLVNFCRDHGQSDETKP